MDHLLGTTRRRRDVVQAQALERPSDPFDELAYMLGGNRQNNKFWQATLHNLADDRASWQPGRRGRRSRLHRPEPAMAPLAQRPQQRHDPVRAPDPHRARAQAHRPGVRLTVS